MQKVSRLYDLFHPSDYHITLDLYQDRPDFRTQTTILGTKISPNEVRLHAKELSVASVLVNGQEAAWRHENDEIIIESDASGDIEITIESSAPITDTMYGVYPCYYTQDGQQHKLLATQFEPNDAERVFPCIDEPEAKAVFHLTVNTNAGQTVLSNMPAVHEDTTDDNLTVTFAPSPQMSTYLLAVVIGEMQSKSATTATGITTTVYSTPVHPIESLDFALSEATKTIEYFEQYFDVPYPLPKADHVALPDFSSGAMENWGLITYRESALLANPTTSTIESRQYVSTVVAHELSHQWFGNLVTMKWWNNLWLNESFASIMEYMAPDALHPEWNIWLDFSTNDAVSALRRDAIDGVQSVQVDVNHPDEINTLFDGSIVYAKGARLMRMMQKYIGDEDFRRGLSMYFEKHKYDNTTEQDLWDALSAASGKDIAALMNAWISQSGYPVVHAHLDDNKLTLTQEQFFVGAHRPSDKLWPIPLDASVSSLPKIFDSQKLEVELTGNEPFQLNIHDSSHFITHYDDQLLAALLDTIKNNEATVVQRVKLLHEQVMLARGQVISPAQLVDILEVYQSETDEQVWSMIAVALGEVKKYVEDDDAAKSKLRKFVGRLSRARFDALGWDAQLGEPENDTKLRPLILSNMIYSEDQSVIDEAIKRARATDFEKLDSQLRAILVGADVRYGDDPEIIERLVSFYRQTVSPDLRSDVRSALTSTRNPSAIKTLISLLTDTTTIRPQDNPQWFVYMLMNKDARVDTWQWMQTNWKWIEQRFTGDKNLDYYPRFAGQVLSTRLQLSEYRAFFEPMLKDTSMARIIEMGLTDLAGRVELIEQEGPKVRARLLEL